MAQWYSNSFKNVKICLLNKVKKTIFASFASKCRLAFSRACAN